MSGDGAEAESRLTAIERGRVADQVQNIDLFPTIAALAPRLDVACNDLALVLPQHIDHLAVPRAGSQTRPGSASDISSARVIQPGVP